MLEITRDEGNKVIWVNDVEEFCDPDTLMFYLEDAAPENSYKIDGYNVWATKEAINAAVRAFEADVDLVDAGLDGW